MLWDIGVIMVCVGVVLLAISLILIFVLKIPDLLDELSGRKARRQIKRLKELNEGTGGLEGMATDDIYQVLPSGSLVSDELHPIVTSGNVSEEAANTGDIQKSTSGNVEDSSGNGVSSDEVENTPVVRAVEISEPDSAEEEDEEPTDFMDVPEEGSIESGEKGSTESEEEEEESTAYIDDGIVTELRSEIQEYVSNKKVIEIVEEQTSLV